MRLTLDQIAAMPPRIRDQVMAAMTRATERKSSRVPPAGVVAQQSEHGIQVDIVNSLRAELPADCIVFAVPNGGGRSKAEAGRLKAEGVVPGIPDLCVLCAGLSGALGLEVKKPLGVQSSIQKAMAETWVACGGRYVVVRSVEEALGAFRSWKHPSEG
jgi:hypothetical protein